MFTRTLPIAMAMLAGCAAFSGCVGDRPAESRAGFVVMGDTAERPDETRSERYARGEYRRGFDDDEGEKVQFCRLHPADTDCIGRRF